MLKHAPAAVSRHRELTTPTQLRVNQNIRALEVEIKNNNSNLVTRIVPKKQAQLCRE